MTDVVDASQLVEEQIRIDAIASRCAVPKPGDGCEDCEQCWQPIHPKRSAMGYRICVLCAETNERRKAAYR